MKLVTVDQGLSVLYGHSDIVEIISVYL